MGALFNNFKKFAWHQTPIEDEISYELFKKYLSLSKPRSLTLLAELTGVKLETINETFKDDNWRDRASEFDQFSEYRKHRVIINEAAFAREAIRDTLTSIMSRYRNILEDHPERLDIQTKDFLKAVLVLNKLDESRIQRLIEAIDIDPDFVDRMLGGNSNAETKIAMIEQARVDDERSELNNSDAVDVDIKENLFKKYGDRMGGGDFDDD